MNKTSWLVVIGVGCLSFAGGLYFERYLYNRKLRELCKSHEEDLGVQSPSKVFSKISEDYAEGCRTGINVQEERAIENPNERSESVDKLMDQTHPIPAYVDQTHPILAYVFDTEDEYNKETLTYYSDGVLAYSNGNRVSDIGGTVGADFESYFGMSEYGFDDDSIYIRNETLMCDFEILICNDEYSEHFGNYVTEDE